ncbi:hypothetical protein M758_7G009000 [Ceratodon purpureus]|nr:hypothetical protein M758_7G009000 [Ceratodon purpureus]
MPSYSSVMEKGHYGSAGASDHGSEDVNSASSTFALDFAGMLDAADSVLHQQIYEYLQGPAVQQADHQHQFMSSSLDQGLGFPSQAQLYPGPPTSFPALSTFQTSMPGEPHRGHTNIVDTGSSHLSRRDGTFEYRRKDQSIKAQAGIGSSVMGMQMLPTGMGSGSALPAQMYSTDVFHPPAQPNLVYNAREFSGYETSCSPNGHLKRPGVEPDILSPHESRPRGLKMQKIEPVQECVKSHRPAEQAEHIIRERQRRDDMTSKFLMLESLLPPGPKRDRSTVVEDSIQYVKSLHHRVKELHQKRSEMKSNVISCQTTDTLKQKSKNVLLNSDQKTQINPPAQCLPKAGLKNSVASPPDESDALAKSSGSIETIEVHLDLPHQIVIEMTCRPHRHIQSQIMVALERLGMDVSRCSISKLHNRLICVLVVKPREMTEPLITSNDVIGALSHAVVPD